MCFPSSRSVLIEVFHCIVILKHNNIIQFSEAVLQGRRVDFHTIPKVSLSEKLSL